MYALTHLMLSRYTILELSTRAVLASSPVVRTRGRRKAHHQRILRQLVMGENGVFTFTGGQTGGTYTDYACGRQSGTYAAFFNSNNRTVGETGVIFALPGKFSRVRTVGAWHERCLVSPFKWQGTRTLSDCILCARTEHLHRVPLLLASPSSDHGKWLRTRCTTQTAPTCGLGPTMMAAAASTPTMARPSSLSVSHSPPLPSPFAPAYLVRKVRACSPLGCSRLRGARRQHGTLQWC